MKTLFFLLFALLTISISNFGMTKLVSGDSLSYATGPSSKIWCYRVCYDADQVPVVGDSSCAFIRDVAWSNGLTYAPNVGGHQWSVKVLATYQDLVNWLHDMNMYMNPDAEYTQDLDTSH
jgi:hypothetical protein